MRYAVRFGNLATLTLALLIIAPQGYCGDNSTLALVTKIIPDVAKKAGPSDWGKASVGDALQAGDRVRTGQQALAVIKFTDQSILRLREQSELALNAEGIRGSMIKNAQLNSGGLGFEIRKQQNEQFRLTSPTSVASIRGTRGSWCGGKGADTLVVIEGLVNLKNILSSRDLDIPKGFIGFSYQDGSLSSRKATDQELDRAAGMGLATGSRGELRLEMKDPQGNKRELKLKIKQ